MRRNIYAKSILSNDLRKRYRSVTQPKRVSDRQTLLENISKDKYVTPSRNSDLEKQEILRNFDPRKVDELRKRQKFAPYDNIPEPVTEPEFDNCTLFDTGFEDNCDYIQYTGILGPFTILQNFESFPEGDTNEDVFLVDDGFYFIEGFETYDEALYDISDGTLESKTITTPSTFNATTDLELSSIKLTWGDVNGEDNYIIERSAGNITNYIVLDTLSQNLTSYTDTNNLVLNTDYYYRLKASSNDVDTSDSNYVTTNIFYGILPTPVAYNQALAVYSLKRRYPVNVIEGYRYADGALLNFTSEELNDGTLKAWADSNGGVVGINQLYNQNGNINHQGNQANKAYLPKIYQNGSVITDPDLSKTCMYLNSRGLLGNFSIGDTWTFIFVGSQKGGGNTRMFSNSIDNRLMTFNRPSASFFDGEEIYSDSRIVPGDSPAIATWIHSPTKNEVYINGNLVSSRAGVSRIWGSSFNIGTSGPFIEIPNAYYFEVLVFDTDQSSNRIEIEEFLNNEYQVY